MYLIILFGMNSILPLVFHPDELLRKKSQNVTAEQILDSSFQQFLLQMEVTMRENKGIGLAAVQVGKLWRVCTIDTEDGVMFLINPIIIKRSRKRDVSDEGCLSIPKVEGHVKRFTEIVVEYTDQEGKQMEIEAKGLFARVIQHEIDHMDGVLFIDKAQDIKGLEKYNEEHGVS